MRKINVSMLVVEAPPVAGQATTSVSIQLLVQNNSSRAVAAGGRWAVKDEDTGTVREATFGRILPGRSEERFVSLPSGVEWGIFDFKAEDGSGSWTAPHAGDDTEAYKLNLGD